MSKRFDPEPVVCAACKRAAGGFGYAPRAGAKIAWVCDNPECAPLGRVVFHMAAKDLNFNEAASLSDAGDEAGAFLESVGKTDLAELTREEWLGFLKTVLTSYEAKMRERLLAYVAPF